MGHLKSVGWALVPRTTLREPVWARAGGHPVPRRARYVRAGVGGGAVAGWAIRAPQEQASQTTPSFSPLSTPLSSSPPRRCSCTKASSAASSSGIVLLDRVIGALQERRRDREPERLGGLHVDDQLELGGLLDGQVAWLGAL